MRFKLCRFLLVALLSAGCLNSALADNSPPLTLRLGFVDPINASYTRGGQKFADELQKLTGGRIVVQVFGDGKLGGETEMVESVLQGKQEMFSACNSVLSQFIPELVLLDLPFLFDTPLQAHAAVDGRLGQLIRAKAAEHGLHIIGFLESGFRDLFSTRPVEKISDFKGLKLRTMENRMQIEIFKALGAEVIPMPAHEQHAALKMGKIEANENAIGNMLVNRYYELIKHVTRTQHQFTFVIVGISEKAYQRIPEELRPHLDTAMEIAVNFQRNDLKEINDYAFKELKAKGIIFHDIDRQQLKQTVLPAIEKMHSKVPREWLDAYNEVVR